MILILIEIIIISAHNYYFRPRKKMLHVPHPDIGSPMFIG